MNIIINLASCIIGMFIMFITLAILIGVSDYELVKKRNDMKISGLDDWDSVNERCITCGGTRLLEDGEETINCYDCNGTGYKFEKMHAGDPCIFCNTPHDDVGIGDCPYEPRNQQL